MKRIFTTVGTSIKTNTKNFDCQNKEQLKKAILQRVKTENFVSLSAETNSLESIGINKDDEIILIYTDTDDGEFCSVILKKILQEKFNCLVRSIRISGLQTQNAKEFRLHGVKNLIHYLLKELDNKTDCESILNVTGGFKSVVPILTIIGMIKKVPVKYIFERSADLITMPPIPIQFDFDLFIKYQKALSEIKTGQVVDWNSFKIKNKIYNELDSLVEVEDNLIVLSAVGEIVEKQLTDYYLIRILVLKQKNFDKLRQFEEAIRELITKLENIIFNNKGIIKDNEHFLNFIHDLKEKDNLRHGPMIDKNVFIFKSVNQAQTRIVYQPELVIFDHKMISNDDFRIDLKVFDFLVNDFDHGVYLKEFKSNASKYRVSQLIDRFILK